MPVSCIRGVVRRVDIRVGHNVHMAASEISPRELLDMALPIAQRAGRFLHEGWFTGWDVDTKSSAIDMVTSMDKGAERLIVDAIAAIRPNDGVLGEEGANSAGTSGVRWIIDPLDGTTNYVYHIPLWGVSVAVEVDGVVVAGVVDVPAQGVTYAAAKGEGAWVISGGTTEALSCSTLEQRSSALVGTGFGYDSARRTRQGAVIAGLLGTVRDIRRSGSCVIDLTWLASGRLDAYFERGLNPWDYSAATLIAREAGAIVSGLDGAEPSIEFLVGAAPAIFTEIHDALVALHAHEV